MYIQSASPVTCARLVRRREWGLCRFMVGYRPGRTVTANRRVLNRYFTGWIYVCNVCYVYGWNLQRENSDIPRARSTDLGVHGGERVPLALVPADQAFAVGRPSYRVVEDPADRVRFELQRPAGRCSVHVTRIRPVMPIVVGRRRRERSTAVKENVSALAPAKSKLDRMGVQRVELMVVGLEGWCSATEAPAFPRLDVFEQFLLVRLRLVTTSSYIL